MTEQKLKNFYDQIDRLYSKKAFGELEVYLHDKLGEEMASNGKDSILITILNELATFYRGQNEPEKSVDYLRMAAEAVQKSQGEDSKEYATLITNLSAAYRYQKNGPAAIQYGEQAVKILKKLGTEYWFFYSAALNNLGMAYLSVGETGTARIHFERAMELLREHGMDRNPDSEEKCVIMINIAYTYYVEKKLRQAEDYCWSTIKEYRNIHRRRWDHIYVLLRLMGDIYRELGQGEKAGKAYQMALKRIEKAAGKNFEYKEIEKRLELISR